MSVVDVVLPTRESSLQAVDGFYNMEDNGSPTTKIPELPQKSSLRSSKILDNHGLKLGGAVEAASIDQASTPHDVYLSSEEDISSDADDFSDYGYDSSVEDPESPTRPSSHEDTARVVSVVFSGKPSIVDLPIPKKRAVSPSSIVTSETRSSIESNPSVKRVTSTSTTNEDRPATPASSIASSPQPNGSTAQQRRSSLLSDILSKKKPPFLSIDPYASGSTYSLPKALDSLENESPATVKTPRTPNQLIKGVTRSFSLVRKRSRPMLANKSVAIPTIDTSVAILSPSLPQTSSATVKRSSLQLLTAAAEEKQQQQEAEGEQEGFEQQQQIPQPQKTPQTPITYNDILRAVKKNAIMMGTPTGMPPTADGTILSPNSPGTDKARRGILSGLSARRKSVKFTGRMI